MFFSNSVRLLLTKMELILTAKQSVEQPEKKKTKTS